MGSRALNNHIKYTEHWLYKCSKCGSLVNFQCQYPRRQSLNHHWSVLLHQTPLHLCLLSNISCQFSTWQRGDKRKRKWWEGLEAIMLNISVKGGRGDYSREAIDQGTAIIRGNTVPQSFQCRQWNGVAVFFSGLTMRKNLFKYEFELNDKQTWIRVHEHYEHWGQLHII